MANFNTHISLAAVASGMLATVSLKLGHIEEVQAVILTAIGTLGGILPDIDLKYSYPSRLIFSFLGILASFITVFAFENTFSIIELWMSATIIFLIVRFPVWMIFHYNTTHRGAIHSIAAAVLFCLLTTVFSHKLFLSSETFSWLCGLYILLGYILHLILDELYSVDFIGNKLKRSFGSALKIVDLDQWITSTIIITACAALWTITPSKDSLLGLFEEVNIDGFYRQFFPTGGWFGTTL